MNRHIAYGELRQVRKQEINLCGIIVQLIERDWMNKRQGGKKTVRETPPQYVHVLDISDHVSPREREKCTGVRRVGSDRNTMSIYKRV